ncbi:MAG: NADH-quinone oxidoreductase subunit F [Chloroflexi bacterium]|nr:NADH-quinone oxidoreductase subunit F [Chloroflexota bacterium]
MPETRIVLKNCGVINSEDINTYLAQDGFKALQKALGMTPEQVIEEVKASGLRGRGGAGFPAGMKWELSRKTPAEERYVICNADEGEVGTFKDRYILQNDPFSLFEGIAIAAYAVGARHAYLYLRAEYHYMLASLLRSLEQIKKQGFLKHVEIHIRQGAGAYVCGEESALMDSIEGRRGEVRYRPPFPPTRGLWGMPTIINNVETMMNIPRVILNGAVWFSQLGTERSKGTKVFSVSGDVERPGVYELVLGSKLKELVVDLAGAKNVKAVQIGGATGKIVPGTMLDTPLSFETILGAGAVLVLDESRDVVDAVYRSVEFLAEESCGKCSPCREGTESLATILERFTRGEGTKNDIALLEELSRAMMYSSLCGLGQAAPIPVMDSLQHFRNEYENRIKTRAR